MNTPAALFLSVLCALSAVGCVASDVGAPCIPEAVPAGGFDRNETYIETASPSCETRYCIVRRLEGDPRPGCTGDRCATEEETQARVYCTAPCTTADDCPEGFGCESLGLAGSLCVHDAL